MMNDLLAKTAQFFLVPEAALSSVFLFIFVVIFIFGLYKTQKCKTFLNTFFQNAEEDFEKIRSKISPDLFIKNNLLKISETESTIQELPNVFVSIGIIATFLGLGVAIQGAAELLQTDKLELTKLTAVLGVIAFKFQTSVWGICFSILFRSAIIESYFEFRRRLIDELYDRLYSSERDGIRSLIEKQNLFLSEHLNWQKKFEEERFSKSTEQHNAQYDKLISTLQTLFADIQELSRTQHKEIISKNNSQHEVLVNLLTAFKDTVQVNHNALANNLDYLVRNFYEFIKISRSFGQNTITFSNSVGAFSTNVANFQYEISNLQKEFSRIIHEDLSAIKTTSEELGLLHTENMEKIHSAHERNIFHTTQELDKLHQKFYLDAKRFSEETLQTLDKIIGQTINNVHDEYARAAYEVRDAIKEIERTLETIHVSVVGMNQEFIAEQKNFAAAWNSATDKVFETIEIFNAASVDESKRLEDTHKNLAAVTLELRDDNTENIKQLETLLKNNAENFSTVLRVLTDLQDEFLKASANFMTEFNSANAANHSELATHSLAMIDSAKALKENVAMITLKNEKSTEKLSGEFVDLKGSLEKLIVAMNSESAALKKGLADFGKANEIIAQQAQENLAQIFIQQKNFVSSLEKSFDKLLSAPNEPDKNRHIMPVMPTRLSKDNR